MGSLFLSITDPATKQISWWALLGLALIILLVMILAAKVPFLRKLGA